MSTVCELLGPFDYCLFIDAAAKPKLIQMTIKTKVIESVKVWEVIACPQEVCFTNQLKEEVLKNEQKLLHGFTVLVIPVIR